MRQKLTSGGARLRRNTITLEEHVLDLLVVLHKMDLQDAERLLVAGCMKEINRPSHRLAMTEPERIAHNYRISQYLRSLIQIAVTRISSTK
jgi:hypothetical protein